MSKKLNLTKTVNRIYAVLKSHVGSNGSDAHLPANEWISGFMTADHVKKLSEANGNRLWISKTNILTLPPGKYEGNQLENTPDVNAVYEVDITIGAQGRKQIFLIESSTGKIYIRNWHTNGEIGSSPNGWTRNFREFTLWEGKESLVGTKINCLQNPRLFTKLRIEIDLDGSGTAQTIIKNISNNKAYSIQGVNLSDSSTSTIMGAFEVNLSLPSGEIYFEISNNRKINYSNEGAVVQQTGLASVIGIYGIQ